MRSFAAAHSEHPVAVEAAAEVLADVTERMEAPPNLAVIFSSGEHSGVMKNLAAGLRELAGAETVVGVSASGVIGGGREVESGPSLSVWLGDTGPLRPVRLEAIDSGRTILGIPSDVEAGSVLLLLADPFSFPVDSLLDTLDRELPDVRVVGGLASAGQEAGGNTLVLDGAIHTDGAVGVLIPPGVATPVVSQGCRPIGQPWVVTDGSGQMLRELGGQTAMSRLQLIIDELDPEDRTLAAAGLHLGIVANEQTERFELGDFLIRSILGVDRTTGALAVASPVEVGQVIQFHVRDAASATEDLVGQLSLIDQSVEGSLLFTCTGRGHRLFNEPHHDAQVVTEIFSEVANAGMFCAGEIGPVGSRNAIHAFTATLLLF